MADETEGVQRGQDVYSAENIVSWISDDFNWLTCVAIVSRVTAFVGNLFVLLMKEKN